MKKKNKNSKGLNIEIFEVSRFTKSSKIKGGGDATGRPKTGSQCRDEAK